MSAKTWKAYSFFDVQRDAFCVHANGPLNCPCESVVATGRGHLLVGIDPKETDEKRPMIKIYTSPDIENVQPVIVGIAEKNFRLCNLVMGQYQDNFMAVCEKFQPVYKKNGKTIDYYAEEEDEDEKKPRKDEVRFYRYRVGVPEHQALRGCVIVRADELAKPYQVAATPKVSRFAVVLKNRRSIRIYNSFDKTAKYDKIDVIPDSEKGIDEKDEEKITNVFLVSDLTPCKLLWVTTTKRVFVYVSKSSSSPYGNKKIIEPNFGCKTSFASTTQDGRLVVFGKDKERGFEVRIYTKDNMEVSPHGPFLIEKEPLKISWMKNSYLIAVFKEKKETKDGPIELARVKIYNHETDSTFANILCEENQEVETIRSEWNSVLLMLSDKSLTRMIETNMQEKIEQLVKNEQFDVALTVCKSQKMSARVEANIHRMQGDALCKKGNFKDAMDEYKMTIDGNNCYLEPSYVITKFIDPQHAELLVSYLEKLGQWEEQQHTTLKFNCYTKLESADGERASRFPSKLEREVEKCEEKARNRQEPPFDIETAIRVLDLTDNPKHYDYALRIAKAYRKHSIYTDMLSKKGHYEQILEYLTDEKNQLETKIVRDILQRYGNDMLLDFYAKEGKLKGKWDERTSVNTDKQGNTGPLSHYLDVFTDKNRINDPIESRQLFMDIDSDLQYVWKEGNGQKHKPKGLITSATGKTPMESYIDPNFEAEEEFEEDEADARDEDDDSEEEEKEEQKKQGDGRNEYSPKKIEEETRILSLLNAPHSESIAFPIAPSLLDKFMKFLVKAACEGLRARPDSPDRERLAVDDIARMFLNFQEFHLAFLCEFIEKQIDTFMKKEGGWKLMRDVISRDTWTTVIELAFTLKKKFWCIRYFNIAKSIDVSSSDMNKKGATRGIAKGNFDSEQLLLVFQMNNPNVTEKELKEQRYGKMLIYKYLNYWHEFLGICEPEEIPYACELYAKHDPTMWRYAFDILLNLPQSQSTDRSLKLFIEMVEKHRSIPLLSVLQILKSHKGTNFGMIKKLTKATLERQTRNYERTKKVYTTLEAYVVAREMEVDVLTHEHFTAKSTRCGVCNAPIDLPAKHFMCGHSLHMKCLGDDLTKCPVCRNTQESTIEKKIGSLKRAEYLNGMTFDQKQSTMHFNIIDEIGRESFGTAQPNYFMRFARLLAGDMLNADEEGIKGAEQLLKEYTGE